MQLKPMFSGEPIGEAAKTIDQNLQSISGRLFSTPAMVDSECVRLLEIAVSIMDAEARGAFVGMIHQWKYLANLQIEAHEAIGVVRRQFESKFGEPSK